MATAFVNRAFAQGLPLWAEVQQSRFGPAHVVVAHYDFVNDLTFAETNLVDAVMAATCEALGFKSRPTLSSLRYAIE